MIFISYSSADTDFVRRLRVDLESSGAHVWAFEHNIEVGQDMHIATEEAIRNCECVCIVLSPESVSSGYARSELNFARKNEKEIIPLLLRNCEIPLSLIGIKHIDFRTNYDVNMQLLLKKLNLKTETHVKPPNQNLNPDKSPQESIQLRHKPLRLTQADIERLFIKKTFFDTKLNPSGTGLQPCYEQIKPKDVKKDMNVIVDKKTGLYWQQSGTKGPVSLAIAEAYLGRINKENFAGFCNWRLPTLDELASLLKPTMAQNTKLYIDTRFDSNQTHVWTVDKEVRSNTWVVDFSLGTCLVSSKDENHYVRAVRMD